MASYIGQASGKSVQYQNISAEDYTQALTTAGLPSELVSVIVDADVQTAHGAMFSTREDLEQLIGRKTTDIQSQVKSLF